MLCVFLRGARVSHNLKSYATQCASILINRRLQGGFAKLGRPTHKHREGSWRRLVEKARGGGSWRRLVAKSRRAPPLLQSGVAGAKNGGVVSFHGAIQ